MSGYMPTVRFETEFEDDRITMTLRMLERKVFMNWMPYFSKLDDDGNLTNQEDIIKLVNESADMLPDYVNDFTGLKDANGNAVDLKAVIRDVYFIQLVSTIVAELIKISQMSKTEGDDLKSDGPLQD